MVKGGAYPRNADGYKEHVKSGNHGVHDVAFPHLMKCL